jgi:periplasmic divalent cation tolerance protein
MAVLIYSTWPDAKAAEMAMAKLLEQQLIACANISASGTSLYRWQGQVQKEPEVQVWMKTAQISVGPLRKAFLELHPHDLPAFLVLPIDEAASHGPFLNWIRDETKGISNG